MFVQLRPCLMTALWLVSFGLLTIRTIFNESPRAGVLSTWSIYVGLIALVVTGWHLLIRERHKVECIAELAAAKAIERQQLHSVDR